MSFHALALVLLAAALHAGWNYLAKSARNMAAFLWWAVFLGALGYGGCLFLIEPVLLPRKVWGLYALSMGAEVGYLVMLVRGYELGDLSLVYPLARGAAPSLIAVWSALFLGERLPAPGYLGVALMVAGILVVALRPRGAGEKRPHDGRGVRNAAIWALAAGFFVSVYSLLDKIIVRDVPPEVYNFWVYAGMAAGWSPFVWLGRRGAAGENFAELGRNWGRILIGMVMNVAGYWAILLALTITSASYVLAARGTSVVMGALLGWLALKEAFGPVRVAGAALMAGGLALVVLAR